MESYRIEHLNFTYPNRENAALSDISLTIRAGEFVTLCGNSGCGKTTLLCLLKPALAPHGSLSGSILFEGSPLAEVDRRAQAAKIGFVMQSPDRQTVTDKVWHELAFGLESLGCPTPEIRTRVSEMASFFGIQDWFHKEVGALSGGQKQILSLASAMVLQPDVLLLDEPTSQLDPIAAREFLGALSKVNRELGTTVILAEHRLEEALPLSDRAVVLDGGRILADAAPKQVGKALKASRPDLFAAFPAPMRIYGALESGSESPLTVREGRAWLDAYAKAHLLDESRIPSAPVPAETEPFIEVKDAWFRYEKNLPDVLKGLNLEIRKGELFAIVGGNGTGKTTALALLAGLNKPYRGEVRIGGERLSDIRKLHGGLLGMLPQDPQSLFTQNSVYRELTEMIDDAPDAEARMQSVAALCRIGHLLDFHPYDLSGGEQQRTALAKVLLQNPQILLLDEPTKGMDAQFKECFADILADLKESGVTVVLVSHDIEFCAAYADRCAMFFDGSVTSVGTPRSFFAGKSFYTTSANRMARFLLPAAVLAEDVILACGGQPPKKERRTTPKITPPAPPQSGGTAKVPLLPKPQPRKLSKQTLAASLFLLFAVPLTVWLGMTYLGGRKYYFVSLLVLLETLLAFATAFERRKPQARELVTVSVLCALAVAGRAAFFMLPQFKPVTALVILSGICLGGETGFLVGAVTAFVSNFFFGQGPWTPWQMFAFGVIGLLTGLLARRGLLGKNKLSLCAYGFGVTLILYGVIMNVASVLMWQPSPTPTMLLAACAAGLPFDLIHAASTAFFLWILAAPIIQKLERVKVKYGLMEG